MQSDVDALFKLPLGEFTSARNELVVRLKKAGQQSEAAEAKALAKPSVSAWVVNQLYWRHGYLFGRLFEAGDRLRRAQSTRKTGHPARDLANARREVVSALATIAADILREGGYSDTRDVMRRITTTLEALSAYGSRQGSPSAGRLTDDLEPPGFESLAAFEPRADARDLSAGEIRPSARDSHADGTKKPAGRVPSPDLAAGRREERRLLAAATTAVRKAERELGAAREQEERAAARRKTAAARAKKSARRRAELETQLALSAKEAQAAHEQALMAEADARAAARGAAAAAESLELALKRVEQLASKHE